MLQHTQEATAQAQAQPGFAARALSWRLGSEITGLDLKRSEQSPQHTIDALWRLLGERGIARWVAACVAQCLERS